MQWNGKHLGPDIEQSDSGFHCFRHSCLIHRLNTVLFFFVESPIIV